MHTLLRRSLLVLILVVIAALAIYPPEKQLRRGKDLAGGVTLTYAVDTGGEPAVIDQIIPVIKDRLDPQGVLDITIIRSGSDRIEITMPLPSERVKRLRTAFEEELAKLDVAAVTSDDLRRILAMSGDARRSELARIAAGNDERRAALDRSVDLWDRFEAARQRVMALQEEIDGLRRTVDEMARSPELFGGEDMIAVQREVLDAREEDIDEAAREAALARRELDASIADLAGRAFNPGDLKTALLLSETPKTLVDSRTGRTVTLPSDRERSLTELRERFPGLNQQIEAVIASWERYADERTALDDTSDLIRLLRGSGVLSFRITVPPATHPDEQRFRDELRERGPRAVRAPDVRWLPLANIETWYDNDASRLEQLTADPAGFFNAIGYVVEPYGGQYYMLAWDRPGLRLTQAEGQWRVTNSFQGIDEKGRPAVVFRMDVLGGDLLGRLTGPNIGQRMAVILDDRVVTAPTLQGRISTNGQITGSFDAAELNYIIRVLNAGSLAARLSPDPVSVNELGPELGADNLRQGLAAGIIALILVSVFMVCYYFFSGTVAVTALVINALLILGAMAIARAAFTLPGIAGIILTFGIAVDANVLIYERIREELMAKRDLRTSVRLGYQKALSAIVDGNVTNLIVCVVLGTVGTPEIKGFAITLGIGVVTTMFTALVVTRIIFSYLVDVRKIKRWPGIMLATAVPQVHRFLEPNIDWLRLRGPFLTISASLIALSFFMMYTQRGELLDTEFRGGTQLTLRFKVDERTGERITKTRREVEERLLATAAEAEQAGDALLIALRQAQVIPVNPAGDGVTSSEFRIKTVISDGEVVRDAVVRKFEDVLAVPPALTFEGATSLLDEAPVFPIVTRTIGESIGRSSLTDNVSDEVGGLAIVVENITPPVTSADLADRIARTRGSGDYVGAIGRLARVIPIETSGGLVRSAAIIVGDNSINYFDAPDRWRDELANEEWALVRQALTTIPPLASQQSFSPAVAQTFRNQAIVAVLLAMTMIIIYVWVRFGSLRYSIAAILTTLHDIVIVVGLIAVAEVIYDKAPALANTLGILPFKIDLPLVAAILTILGYSLNDTIIIMDRIRENRGKLPYASRSVVNLSINQTISRTVITSGTTMLAVLVLYIFGGEGVREFAYALLVGIGVGTFSSIAVAAPLVWVPSQDRDEARLADANAIDQAYPTTTT